MPGAAASRGVCNSRRAAGKTRPRAGGRGGPKSRSFLDAPVGLSFSAEAGDLPVLPGGSRGVAMTFGRAARPLPPAAAPVSNLPRSGFASPPCSRGLVELRGAPFPEAGQASRGSAGFGAASKRAPRGMSRGPSSAGQRAGLSVGVGVARGAGGGSPAGRPAGKGPRSTAMPREAVSRRLGGPRPGLGCGAGLRRALRSSANSAPKTRGRKAGAPEAAGGVVDNCGHQRACGFCCGCEAEALRSRGGGRLGLSRRVNNSLGRHPARRSGFVGPSLP